MLDKRYWGFAVTKLLEDRLLQYLGPRGESLTCRVRLFQISSAYVLVATDLGKGLTDTIDRIATIMVRRWEIEPSKLRMIEHHDYRGEARSPEQPMETFAFVGFDWHKTMATNPTWRYSSRTEVQTLIGNETLW